MKIGFHRLAAALAVATFLAPPLRAGTSRACPAIDPPARAVRPQPGWRVFRDPRTGKLRPPTPEEAAELAKMEAEAGPEAEPIFVVVEHPDGMKSVDLQGAFAQSIIVTRNADGSLRFRCVPARLAAASAAAPVPAAVAQTPAANDER